MYHRVGPPAAPDSSSAPSKTLTYLILHPQQTLDQYGLGSGLRRPEVIGRDTKLNKGGINKLPAFSSAN